jgi:hypothetical protein
MLPPGATPAGGQAGPSVDALLPPGAEATSAASVDALLPPGAGPGDVAHGKQDGKEEKKRETVTIPTGDGYVTLQAPVKKVGSRELVSLSPEQKSVRRLWTNVIVAGICAVVLVAALTLLMVMNQ